MGREKLSRDDQEQLDYIDAWCEMKREKVEQKQQRKKARELHLKCAWYHASRTLAELKQYFELLVRRK